MTEKKAIPPRRPLLRPSTQKAAHTRPHAASTPPTSAREEAHPASSQRQPPAISLPPIASPQPSEESLLSLGYLTKAHGLSGDMHLHLHNPHGDALYEVERIYLRRRGEGHYRTALLNRFDEHADAFLLSMEGVKSREQAEALRHTELFVKKADLPPLEEGEYYLFQLEGLRVQSPEGEPLGHVIRVQEGTAQDLLVIEYQGREILVPIVDALVPEINISQGRIVVTPLPGLFDE